MTFSLMSWVGSGEAEQRNQAWLLLNGVGLGQAVHHTYSKTTGMDSTGGRVVTLKVSAGDFIELRTTRMDGAYWYIYYCAEFIPKM